MKYITTLAAMSTITIGAAFAQELTVGSPMPDPRKTAYLYDIETQQWPTCLIQIYKFSDHEQKKLTHMMAFPSLVKEEPQYLVWDIAKKKFYVDNRHKDGKKGPDGFIDEIVEGKVDILQAHPYCNEKK